MNTPQTAFPHYEWPSAFTNRYFDNVRRLGDVGIDLASLYAELVAAVEPQPEGTVSPETLTQRLHSFLAETQAVTTSQLQMVTSWKFVRLDARLQTEATIGDTLGANILYATGLLN